MFGFANEVDVKSNLSCLSLSAGQSYLARISTSLPKFTVIGSGHP